MATSGGPASHGALGVVAVRDQVEFVILTYQVEAEAVVWCVVDESEPGGKVEMTRSCKRVIGPEHQSAVTGRTRASQCRPESNGDPAPGHGRRC